MNLSSSPRQGGRDRLSWAPESSDMDKYWAHSLGDDNSDDDPLQVGRAEIITPPIQDDKAGSGFGEMYSKFNNGDNLLFDHRGALFPLDSGHLLHDDEMNYALERIPDTSPQAVSSAGSSPQETGFNIFSFDNLSDGRAPKRRISEPTLNDKLGSKRVQRKNSLSKVSPKFGDSSDEESNLVVIGKAPTSPQRGALPWQGAQQQGWMTGEEEPEASPIRMRKTKTHLPPVAKSPVQLPSAGQSAFRALARPHAIRPAQSSPFSSTPRKIVPCRQPTKSPSSPAVVTINAPVAPVVFSPTAVRATTTDNTEAFQRLHQQNLSKLLQHEQHQQNSQQLQLQQHLQQQQQHQQQQQLQYQQQQQHQRSFFPVPSIRLPSVHAQSSIRSKAQPLQPLLPSPSINRPLIGIAPVGSGGEMEMGGSGSMPPVAVPRINFQQFVPTLSSASPPSTPTHTRVTPSPSQSPTPAPYVSLLPESNAYRQATWAEVFARVIQILKRDKMRQKFMATEVGFSGSTLSAMLHGKYRHTKEVHVAHLRDWCYTKDSTLVSTVAAQIQSCSLDNEQLADSLDIDHAIFDKYMAFTLPTSEREAVDIILAPWLRGFVFRQNTARRQQQKDEKLNAAAHPPPMTPPPGAFSSPYSTSSSFSSPEATSSCSSSPGSMASSSSNSSPLQQQSRGHLPPQVPDGSVLIQLLQSYRTGQYPPVRPTPTSISTPTLAQKPLLFPAPLVAARSTTPTELKTVEHIENKIAQLPLPVSMPPLEEPKQIMMGFLGQQATQGSENGTVCNALFEQFGRQPHETQEPAHSPDLDAHSASDLQLPQVPIEQESQLEQLQHIQEEEQGDEGDEIDLAFDSFLSK